MSKTKPAWRHHYLSQFYLGGFTASGQQDDLLWITDLHDHRQWQDIPRNVGYVKHFNTIDIPGLDPDAIEKALATGFEGRAADVLGSILASTSLPEGGDRLVLANLVALFGVRNPQFGESRREFEERVRLRIIENLLSSQQRYESEMERMNEERTANGEEPCEIIPYENAKLLFEKLRWRLNVPTEQHLITELDLLDTIIPHVLKRKWILSIAPDGCEFICSDRPVSLVWTSPIPPVTYAPGFGVPNSELTFPLSKRLALTGTFVGKETVVEVARARVNQINDRTVGFAERFLYSAGRSFSFSDADGTMRNVQDILARNG